MTSRSTIGAGPATGADVMANLNAHVAALWNASALPLTGVGGTGNAVTATLDPALLAGLVEGMKFTLTWAAANTGAMTLSLNGATGVAVLDADGAALVGGEAVSGQRALLEVVGSSLRILSSAGGEGGAAAYYSAFTASGTWTVPTGYDADTPVLLQAWGGGGGGGTLGTGGGGGGFVERRMRFGDLGASYTITIGAGGAAGAAGGTTTVGSILSAYGGGRGENSGTGGGGAGGSAFAAGGNGGSGTGGVAAGRDAGSGGNNGAAGQDAVFCGGGGGGGGGSGNAGGRSVHGGGGGGGATGAAGTSVFGGNGGAAGAAGSAPGGGGGSTAAGARGEVRIWIG